MKSLKEKMKIQELYEEIPFVKKRKKWNLLMRLLKYLSISIIVLCLLFFVYILFHLLTFESIYNNLVVGRRKIEYSVHLIKTKNFSSARKYAREAQTNFREATDDLEKVNENLLISKIFFIQEQLSDVVYLVKSADILSGAALYIADTGNRIDYILGDKKVSFSELSQEKRRAILQVLAESTPELNGLRANIYLVNSNIERMNFGGILLPIRSRMKLLQKYLVEANDFLDDAVPISQVMPALLGYPKKSTFLVMMQNKDELRPTGGFLGTYGILQIEDAEILRMDTHDIYHMDMPVKDAVNVVPPAPIKKYLVDKWYMRDANWSPDWPTTAEKIKWFYHLEDGLLPKKDQVNNFSDKFDGVIGINSDLIAKLLGVVGSVTIDGETYNEDNFSKLLEYRVEKGYLDLGIPSWHRKEVIGDIVKVLEQRILDKPVMELYNIYALLSDNLLEKNIVFNFSDNEFQEIFREKNWTGHIRKADDDYLMVVDANMGALKTDAVMTRNIEYSLDETVNGVFADLKINYSNNGKFDWRTTKYRTYTRVYVPLGSDLIEVEEVPGGVDISEENGKTVFGSFIEIEPQAVGTLHFYYKLPAYVADSIRNSQYKLLIQKQPGNNIESLDVDLEFMSDVTKYAPASFYASQRDGNVTWSTDLTVDREFEADIK